MENLEKQAKQQGNQAGKLMPDNIEQLNDTLESKFEYKEVEQMPGTYHINHYVSSIDGDIHEDPRRTASATTYFLKGLPRKLQATFNLPWGLTVDHLPDFTLVAYKDENSAYLGSEHVPDLSTLKGEVVLELRPPEGTKQVLLSSHWDNSPILMAEYNIAIDLPSIVQEVERFQMLAPKMSMQLEVRDDRAVIENTWAGDLLKTKYTFSKKRIGIPNFNSYGLKCFDIIDKASPSGARYPLLSVFDAGPSLVSPDFGAIISNAYPVFLAVSGMEDLDVFTSDEGDTFKVVHTGTFSGLCIPVSPLKNIPYSSTITLNGKRLPGNFIHFDLAVHESREIKINGNYPIKEIGKYECYECKIIDTYVEYDPATITTWSPDGPSFESAEPMVRITSSYTVRDNACTVNTFITFLKDTPVSYIGAGIGLPPNFTSVMVPKLRFETYDFNRPINMSALPMVRDIRRSTSFLPDINAIPDRSITLISKSLTGGQPGVTYQIATAFGQSLISGASATNKKNEALLENNTIGRIGKHAYSYYAGAETRFAAFEASGFAEHKIPAGFSQEINYYIVFFMPEANSQDYWYKDGSTYIIYSHSQKQTGAHEIALPSDMEGLALEIVEKTEGAELLTDRVIDSKIRIKYSDAANYIVIKAS